MNHLTSTRCVYFHIDPQPFDRQHLHLPMQFLLQADDRPTRKMHRLYGGFATERILLDGGEHTLTLRLPDGTALRSLRLPADGYNYMITLSEPDGFTVKQAGPMAPTAPTADIEKLSVLLTGKLMRSLNPASPFCHLYKDLTERDLDYLWFEFWETAVLTRFMPKSGHIPDLKKDFDLADRYPANAVLTFAQTMELEARMEQALQANEAMKDLEFFRNENGFLSVRAK